MTSPPFWTKSNICFEVCQQTSGRRRFERKKPSQQCPCWTSIARSLQPSECLPESLGFCTDFASTLKARRANLASDRLPKTQALSFTDSTCGLDWCTAWYEVVDLAGNSYQVAGGWRGGMSQLLVTR